MEQDTSGTAPPPGLWQIFRAFAKIGLTSFGGGISGWMMREFVLTRHWLDEKEFLSGLALSQAFPGVNVVNLAIWIGYRLRGGPGALAGAIGMVVPAMIVMIGLVAVFDRLTRFSLTHVLMAGVAAAAIGLSLHMGLRAARQSMREVVPALIMAATFAAIFVFRLPLLLVVAVLAPLSIGIAYIRLRKNGTFR